MFNWTVLLRCSLGFSVMFTVCLVNVIYHRLSVQDQVRLSLLNEKSPLRCLWGNNSSPFTLPYSFFSQAVCVCVLALGFIIVGVFDAER